MQKICVVGLGYIGLPTCIILSQNNYKVIGCDINSGIVNELNKGNAHIEEPFICDTLKQLVSSRRITFRSEPERADAFIIAVPTPVCENHTCDLSCVISAVNSIIPVLQDGNLIILESTVPPGTIEKVVKPLIEACGFCVGMNIYLAHCPERVLPGNIFHELVNNNRIIGGCTEECAKKASEIYESFVKGEIILTDANTAEMSKLVENSYRDVNIAFANELVLICNELGLNAIKVIQYANMHPRVNILNPGPGVGGHCIAVDPYFIIEKAVNQSKLLAVARETNNSMPEFIFSKTKELLKGVEEPKITIFGITYKGNIDDVRESPALKIYNMFIENGFTTVIYDPHVKKRSLEISDFDTAIDGSDMILILTDHNEFKELDMDLLANKMHTPIIFDTKNILKSLSETAGKVAIYNLGNAYSKLAK